MAFYEPIDLLKSRLRAFVQEKLQGPQGSAIVAFLNVKSKIDGVDRQEYLEGRACLLPHAVDRCVMNIMTIANNESLDSAVAETLETRLALCGLELPREFVQKELKLCGQTFADEVEFCRGAENSI